MNILFIAAVVVIAGVAFYLYKQTSQTLSQLQADGFTVDQEIPSNPRIVIDHQQKRLALIYAKSYELIEFSQIESAKYESRPGDDDREHHRVVITLKDHPKDKIKIRGRKVSTVEGWAETLDGLKSQ